MNWSFIFTIIGVIVAGVVAGFVISFIILKVMKRPFPFSANSRVSAGGSPAHSPAAPVKTSPKQAAPAPGSKLGATPGSFATYPAAPETPHVQKRAEPTEVKKVEAVPEAKPIPAANPAPVQAPPSEAMLELESNLAIAIKPSSQPISFHTDVWDSRHSQYSGLSKAQFSELTEAYADMALANNLVSLIIEAGQNNGNLTESYTKTCRKIAARLQHLIPEIKEILG